MACLKIGKSPSTPNRVVTNKFTGPRSSLARPQLSTPQCRPPVRIGAKKTVGVKRVECLPLSTGGGQDAKNVRNRRVASYPSSAVSGGPNRRFVDRGEYVAKDEFDTVSTSLEELKKRFDDVALQLERSENEVKSLVERLNETRSEAETKLERSENEVKSLRERLNRTRSDAETQTHGIRTEELEKSLQQVSDRNRSLTVALRSSDLEIANFKRDARSKTEKIESAEKLLKSMTERNSALVAANEQAQKNNTENLERIESLWKERNEFKIGYLDASKERDDAAEEAFELKHKLTKMEKLVDKYASEEKQRRANFIHHSLEMSDLAEKNKELLDENTKSKETISALEQTVRKCLEENTESTEKIVELEETISELKDEIRSWETRIECKLSTVIRNKFGPRFDEKNTEIVRLNRELNKTVADSSVKLACLEKNNEVKQSTIDMQQGVIKLLKELKEKPRPTNQNLRRLHQRMDEFLLEYEDILSFMNSKFYRNWLKETSY